MRGSILSITTAGSLVVGTPVNLVLGLLGHGRIKDPLC